MVGLNRRTEQAVVDPYDNCPSPDQIQEMTAAIREKWSPRMRSRRRIEALGLVGLIEMPLLPRRKGSFED